MGQGLLRGSRRSTGAPRRADCGDCVMFQAVASGMEPRRSPEGDRKALWSCLQARNPAPQFPRHADCGDCVMFQAVASVRVPEGVQRATGKPSGRARRRETLRRSLRDMQIVAIAPCNKRRHPAGLPKESRGRPESPLVAPAGAKPCAAVSATCKLRLLRHVTNGGIRHGTPKESRGRSESPLVAPAGAKPCAAVSASRRVCHAP